MACVPCDDLTLILEPGASTREVTKAVEGAMRLGYGYLSSRHHVPWWRRCPVGSVEFCESFLPVSPSPDFHPEFLRVWLRRRTWIYSGHQPHASQDWFVKPIDRYKSGPARIVRAGCPMPSGPTLVSEVVEFTQEWRYYVADGCVLATGWYAGTDESEPAPDLGVSWPPGFCGAVDFGRLATGEIALIESHHPYACGWYGDDSAAYVTWLVEGWLSVRRGICSR